jgi:hypothetical protein
MHAPTEFCLIQVSLPAAGLQPCLPCQDLNVGMALLNGWRIEGTPVSHGDSLFQPMTRDEEGRKAGTRARLYALVATTSTAPTSETARTNWCNALAADLRQPGYTEKVVAALAEVVRSTGNELASPPTGTARSHN